MYSYSVKKIIKKRPSNRRGGFVLVMSLVLITLASFLLSRLSQKSLQLVQQANAAQEDLQRRWGTLSCQRVLLDQAKSLIDGESLKLADERRYWPLPSQVSKEFQLGKLLFQIRVSDEDAKVNLNKVFRMRSNRLSSKIQQMLNQVSGVQDSLRVSLPSNLKTKKSQNPIQSWGEVFSWRPQTNYSRAIDDLQLATQEMTCWGNGRLNIKRASDFAIRIICGKGVSQTTQRKLLELRQRPETGSLNSLLRQLALRGKERLLLRQLLTDRSHVYSLWITAKSHQRSWTELVVDDANPTEGYQQQIFVW